MILEMFSGNAHITEAFKSAAIECKSLDYNPSYNADYCKDAYTLSEDFLKSFAFIWLSPDCTTYSLASHGLHRKAGGVPVSDYAKECDVNNAILISKLLKLNIPFIIENPRGHFRNMDFVRGLNRITIYYSTYGEVYEKPTDLFSNVLQLLEGFNTEHIKGTKHLDYVRQYNNFLGRCLMPKGLIDDVVKSVRRVIKCY